MKKKTRGSRKNMIKRSWLSIKRKSGRTVLMVALFFIMANLVLSTIIIKTAVNAQMDYAKASLGGTVSLSADMDKIREEQKENKIVVIVTHSRKVASRADTVLKLRKGKLTETKS